MSSRKFVEETFATAEALLGIQPADPTANWKPYPGRGLCCCKAHEQTMCVRWNAERMGWESVYIECSSRD